MSYFFFFCKGVVLSIWTSLIESYALYFSLNTHLQPTQCLPSGKGTKNQVLLSSNQLNIVF